MRAFVEAARSPDDRFPGRPPLRVVDLISQPEIGWPEPDSMWEPGRRHDTVATLPWAVWQPDPAWYFGFYTCHLGHAWTHRWETVISLRAVRGWAVSPFRTMPDPYWLWEEVDHLVTAIRPVPIAWPPGMMSVEEALAREARWREQAREREVQ